MPSASLRARTTCQCTSKCSVLLPPVLACGKFPRALPLFWRTYKGVQDVTFLSLGGLDVHCLGPDHFAHGKVATSHVGILGYHDPWMGPHDNTR